MKMAGRDLFNNTVPVKFTENGKIAHINKDKAKIYQLKYIELTGEGEAPPQTPPSEIRHKKMCGPTIFILATYCSEKSYTAVPYLKHTP